jgi:hypothetical protein
VAQLVWPQEGDGAGNGVSAEQHETQPPVCVGVVDGPINGEIARSFLESAGIPAFVQRDTLGAIYGLTTGSYGRVAIFVPAAFADEARALFAELSFD